MCMHKPISPYATVARLNKLAVLIEKYGEETCEVRYIGCKGKKINPGVFFVKTSELTEF